MSFTCVNGQKVFINRCGSKAAGYVVQIFTTTGKALTLSAEEARKLGLAIAAMADGNDSLVSLIEANPC